MNSGGLSHAVGTKLPNRFGLYDMHGNLYEWCQDFWDEKWYEKSPPSDPTGPFGLSPEFNRVVRGGTHTSNLSHYRSAYRTLNSPSARFLRQGFRVVRVADAPATTVGVASPPTTPVVAPPPITPSAASTHFALEFDGIDDYVDLNSDWTWDGSDLTFDAWVHFLGKPRQKNMFLFVIDHGGSRVPRHATRLLNGTQPDDAGGQVTSLIIAQGAKPNLQRYVVEPLSEGLTHLAAVWKQGQVQLFLNGKLQSFTIQPFPASDRGGPPYMCLGTVIGLDGAQVPRPKEFWQGRIYQARLSSKALYQADFTPSESLNSGPETIALYSFNEGTGDVLRDSSGHGRHGRIVGAKWSRIDRPAAVEKASWIPSVASPPLAIAPFDVAQAKAHQAVWSKHLGTTVETTNSVGAKMILIPPGEFLMGSADEQVEAALKVADEINADQQTKVQIQKSERPQHKVVITKPLLMSATEVTIGQFKKFTAATGYQTEAEKRATDAKTNTYLDAASDDFPAAYINWNDATAYCQWLSTQEKTTYRLPTEAEWEYACRAGTTTQYSFGDDYNELTKYGWHNQNAGAKSHPVGTLLPNNFGLFDMHGNLHEWCGDYFGEKWYAESALNDPNGPSVGSIRVFRGGYWSSNASHCRSAYRHALSPVSRNNYFGFRCVRVLDAPATTASVTPQSAVAAASSTKLFMHDPAFPKWMKDVQAMPAEKQLEAVSKKLMELNPGLDGKLTAYSGPSKIKDGVVTDLGFVADHVTDISPLRALSQLKALNCSSSTWKGTLADLRPLQGMQLKKLRLQGNTSLTDISPLQGMLLDELDFYVCYQLTDLKPLQGMPITTLHIGNTKANDLSPLHGMPLKKLNLFNCPARDLSPLEGMPLEALTIHNFDKVEDFTPIQSLPLRAIHCVSSTERDLALFRSLKTVNTINGKPAAEFWKEVEEQKGKKP